MIYDLIVFGAGFYCGHVLSPWIDGKILDWRTSQTEDGMKDEDFK
jgi:hypothetical protein